MSVFLPAFIVSTISFSKTQQKPINQKHVKEDQLIARFTALSEKITVQNIEKVALEAYLALLDAKNDIKKFSRFWEEVRYMYSAHLKSALFVFLLEMERDRDLEKNVRSNVLLPYLLKDSKMQFVAKQLLEANAELYCLNMVPIPGKYKGLPTRVFFIGRPEVYKTPQNFMNRYAVAVIQSRSSRV